MKLHAQSALSVRPLYGMASAYFRMCLPNSTVVVVFCFQIVDVNVRRTVCISIVGVAGDICSWSGKCSLCLAYPLAVSLSSSDAHFGATFCDPFFIGMCACMVLYACYSRDSVLLLGPPVACLMAKIIHYK